MTASWPYCSNVNSALTAIAVDVAPEPPQFRQILQRPRLDPLLVVPLEIELDRQHVGAHGEAGITGKELARAVPCPRVQVGGLLHPSLRHGRHPQANVDKNGAEPHVLGEVRLPLQAVPAARLEVGAFVAGQAEQVVPGADDERGRGLAIGGHAVVRHQRVDLVLRQSIGAARQHPLREDPVDGQRLGIATLPVAREAVSPLPDRLVERGRLLGLQRQAENDAVQEREPRIPLQDLRGQEPVGRDQPAVARPQPQRVGADAFDQLADQPAVARRARMAPRRRQIVPADQRERDRAHSRFPGHALTPTGVMAIRCKQFHLPDL